MRKINRYIFLFFMVILVAGCAQKQDKNVLKLRVGGEPSLINPVLSTDSASSTAESLIFNGLVKINQDLEIVPDLAELYEISPDGKTYTFYLKKNVLWHDGKKFTAKDVKFTFETILDKNTNTVRRSNYIIDNKPIEFEVVNDYTVKIILPKTFAPFLTRMAMGILPEHILKKEDINKTSFNRKPIGTGPFVFDKWKSGQYVYLKRNENYFDKKPKLKGILIKVIPDSNTAMIALKKGEIDLAGIPSNALSQYKFDENIKVYNYQDLLYTYIGLNLKNPLFADKRVRQAMAHAINKKIIVKNVLKNFGSIALMPASPVLWSYPKNAKEAYEYNPQKSRELLEKAGFKKAFGTNILSKEGKPFEFTLITNKGNKDREKTAQILQRFFDEVGIKMNIQLMEWSAFVKLLNAQEDPKPFEAVLLAWSLSIDPDAYSIWHSSQYPKGFNFIGYKNKQVDNLLTKGRLEMNKKRRTKIYNQLFPKIAEDVPYIFLFYPTSIVGVQRYVKGLSKPGPAGLLNPIENIYLDKETI